MPDLPTPVVLYGARDVGIVGESHHVAVLKLDRLVGADEELELHLLELARAERVVARRHLVAEGLPHLRDAVGNRHARGRRDVQELREDRLRRLGTEVGDVRRVVDRTDHSLEHQVEGLGLRQLAAAVGAEEVGPRDLRLGLLLLVCVDVLDLVGAHQLLAVLAHRHRIGESVEVPRRLPDLRVHDDRGVEPGDILASADGELPPGLLHVGLELAAEGTVVPEPGHAAIDFRRMVNEPATLAQSRESVERRFVFFCHSGAYYTIFAAPLGQKTNLANPRLCRRLILPLVRAPNVSTATRRNPAFTQQPSPSHFFNRNQTTPQPSFVSNP